MDPTGEGVFGFVFEVRVWTLKNDNHLNHFLKEFIFCSRVKQNREKLGTSGHLNEGGGTVHV